MEKHTNKYLFAGLLAISCAFAMSGCDPIESLPANYNDPILQYYETNKVVNVSGNIMGEIYNKIAGDKNNTVLQLVLDELATNKFGTYEEFKLARTSTAEMKKFIDKHAEIFKRDEDENVANKTADEVRQNRFEKFAEDVDKRISEEFYNLITSGTYNDKETGMFSEEKLWKELKYQLWDLNELPDGGSFKTYYVTNELTKENATNSKYLNISLYSKSGRVVENDPKSREYRGYIEKKIFPKILKDKLVEEYIYNNNYSSLGRSYARYVNTVKVPYTTSTIDYIDHVMNSFAENEIINANVSDPVEINYSTILKAINGFDGINAFAEKENKPLISLTKRGTATVGGQTVDKMTLYPTTAEGNKAYTINQTYNFYTKKDVVVIDTTGKYAEYYTPIGEVSIFGEAKYIEVFGDTKLGELLESYKKAIEGSLAGDRYATAEQKAELAKYNTGDSMADTLKEKIIDLTKNELSTKGWFVKNGGLSDLPSALRDRLFNINVANDLDKAEGENGAYVLETKTTFAERLYQYPNGDKTQSKVTKAPYARNINGRKLVMASNADFSVDNNFIYDDGSSFYICQVIEAPSTPKLNKDRISTSYTTGTGSNKVIDSIRIENIAREITKILSTKDSYYNNAYTNYLEEYKDSFLFNDTSLYEHFKSQYPDLFDDED